MPELLSCRQMAAVAPAASGGHLFIVKGDVRKIASDAWLCPVDSDCKLEPFWMQGLNSIPGARSPSPVIYFITFICLAPPAAWSDAERVVVPADPDTPGLCAQFSVCSTLLLCRQPGLVREHRHR